MSNEQQAPARLLEMIGPVGDCLREVLAEQALVATPPRFALLRERRQRRVHRQRGVALVGLAVVALVCFRGLRREESSAGISPEPVARLSNQGDASTLSKSTASASSGRDADVVAETPSTRLPQLEPPPSVSAKPVAARASAEPRAGSEEHTPAALDAQPSSGQETNGTAKACADLARGGAAEQALSCYAKLASGNGMTAELALFEQARLEGKVLRRPDSARLTLDEYRRRFPRGSLRAEVMLAQIDWLLASGDSARALELVDEALGSGLLRERTAELERLRSTLTATPAAGH